MRKSKGSDQMTNKDIIEAVKKAALFKEAVASVELDKGETVTISPTDWKEEIHKRIDNRYWYHNQPFTKEIFDNAIGRTINLTEEHFRKGA